MKTKLHPAFTQFCMVLFSATLLWSCGNDDDNTADKEGPAADTKTVVYTSGYSYSSSDVVGPRYWKDGELVALSDNANEGKAKGIFVTNGDVYVVGEERNAGIFVAKYWENGVAVESSDPSKSAWANDIVVDRGDVYIVGDQYEPVLSTSVAQAKYWKNGVEFPLSTKMAQRGAAGVAITVVGDDVYAAGHERNGTYNVAKYWKNGEAVSLSDGTSNAEAHAIAVIDGNVHVAGHVRVDDVFIATYWLNGVATQLPGYSYGNMASGMAISGGNVYISLLEQNKSDKYQAKYWKVGHGVVELTTGTKDAYAHGIAIDGNDVYVVGQYDREGCIWKNGEMTLLPSGGSTYFEATGIFLAKEPV